MARTIVSLRLRERLGHEASEDLVKTFDEVQLDMLAITQEKFEARLAVSASELRVTLADACANLRTEMANLRTEMAEGFANVRKEMSEMRADMIRWSFVFRIGEVAVLIAVLSYMLRPLIR